MAEWTGLQIAQEFCKRKGLPQPSSLTGATDDTTNQIWGLLNEGMQDMAQRYNLTALRKYISFTHAGGASGYPFMAYDVGANLPDWKFYHFRTLWDITDRLEVAGPLSEKQWQVLTTMLIAASRYQFTFYNNQFQIFPVPAIPPGPTFSFFYQSRYPVFDPLLNSGAGGTNDIFSSDSAYPILPRELILADIKWRYAKEKRLAYAEDQRTFEGMLVNYVDREPQPQLILDAPEYDPTGVGPGLLIPAGNWGTFGPI